MLQDNWFYQSILSFVRIRFVSDRCWNEILAPCCVMQLTVFFASAVCIPHLAWIISCLISDEHLELEVLTRIILCISRFVIAAVVNSVLTLWFISIINPKISSLEILFPAVLNETSLMTNFGLLSISASLTKAPLKYVTSPLCAAKYRSNGSQSGAFAVK